MSQNYRILACMATEMLLQTATFNKCYYNNKINKTTTTNKLLLQHNKP